MKLRRKPTDLSLAFIRKTDGYNKEREMLPKAPAPKYFPWCDSGLSDHVMDWKDEALEAAMREVTGIKKGDIMLSDVYKLTRLQLNEKGIERVDALNELVNLQSLVLENNSISSIAGLTNLKNLTFLNLYKNNVADIGGIAHIVCICESGYGCFAACKVDFLKGFDAVA